MGVISGGQIIPGAIGRALPFAGTPSAGTDEVQFLQRGGTPSGGTFRLGFEGFTSGTIAYDAGTAAINAALAAMPSIGGSANILVGGTALSEAGTTTVTFRGARGAQSVGLLTLAANSLTGGTAPTVTITEGTAGVTATYRGVPKGGLIVDTDSGTLYVNTGTETDPTWTVAGTQS